MTMTMRNLLLAALVLSFAGKGMGSIFDCTKRNIIIQQERTGEMVDGKPVFSVMVFNACPCFQSDVVLDCTGFRTVQAIDRSEVAIKGNKCVILGGSGLAPYEGADFTYAWDNEYHFKPTHANVNCDYAPKE